MVIEKKYRVSEGEFKKIQETVRQKLGLNFEGNTGRESGKGVTIEWKYESGELTVGCLSKPFFVSKEFIGEQLDKLVGQ